MAQNTGIVQLTGRVGSLVFSRNGTVSATPSRPSGPLSVGQAASRAEFRTASKAGKLFRDSLRRLKGRTKYARLTGRVSARMREILRLDTVHAYGERRILTEHAGGLVGFQFNADKSLPPVLQRAVISDDGRRLTIPEVLGTRDLNPPQGATHFDLFADFAWINFGALYTGNGHGGFILGDYSDPAPRAIGTLHQNLMISCELLGNNTVGPEHVLVIALGVEFLQLVNGKFYRLYHSGKRATPYDVIYAQPVV